MSKYIVLSVTLLVGCGPQRFGTCPILNTLDGFQPTVEGVEVTSVLAGPAASCARSATVELELTAPDGTKVAVNRVDLIDVERPGESFINPQLRAASVRFTASQVGIWSVVARWSTGGESQRSVLVAPTLSTGPTVLRRFIDRMDNCDRGPFRTNSGTMLCERAGQIWTYGANGELQEYFPGTQLAVRGDEVWSWSAGALEHRTALPGALRSDGSVPLIQLGPEGVTAPGLAIRGDTNRVIEARWDGTTLTSTTIAEGYPIFDPMVVTQGTETWTPEGCQIQRGCSIAQCQPVRTCPTTTLGVPLGIESDRIWSAFAFETRSSLSVGRINVTQRPLDTGRGPSSFIDVFFEAGVAPNVFSVFSMVERARIITTEGVVFLPYEKAAGTVDLVAIRDPGFARTVTADWMVSNTGDPFTLLSTPMPSIP